MSLRDLHARWNAFASTKRGARLAKVSRVVFLAAIVGVLIYQLSEIGWTRIMTSLPAQPGFYVLVLAMYFVLPVTESLIYGRLWSLPPLGSLGVMIRKRVLNVDVLGYSGEVYLFLWAEDRVAAPARAIMGAIKDNLIVSAASSLLAAALLIGGFLLTGQIPLGDLIDTPRPLYAGLGGLAALFLGIVVYRFRRVIFSLARRTLALLACAHLARFVTGYALQVTAWWIVIPAASFQTWAILLVVFVLINRIPLLPSSDIVFVSAGAGIAPLLDVPVAPVVGMLLVRSAADRLLNLLFFTVSVWFERQRVSTGEDAAVNLVSDVDEQDRRADPERVPSALNT